jgi:glycosyltransferase involved in cell wall biosynthesis
VQLAVESILRQTHGDFDFLVIHDGSEPVVREYLESIQDSRVRVIHHETSIGVSRSLNKGLRRI